MCTKLSVSVSENKNKKCKICNLFKLRNILKKLKIKQLTCYIIRNNRNYYHVAHRII